MLCHVLTMQNRHGFGSNDDAADSETATIGSEAPRASENVDTEKMSAFFAGLMSRQSQAGKT